MQPPAAVGEVRLRGGPPPSGKPARRTGYRAGAALAAGAGVFAGAGYLGGNGLLQVLLSLAAGLAVWAAGDLRASYAQLWRTVSGGAARRGTTVPLGALSLVCCTLVLWGLAGNLIDPQYGTTRFAHLPVLAATAAAAVLLPAAAAAAAVAARYLAQRRTLRRALLAAFFAAFFLLQVRIGYAVRIPPGWDAQMVLDSAAALASGSIDTLDTGYFSSFPNNLTLTLALAGYFDVVLLFGVTDLMLAAVVLNCLVLTLGAVLTYAVARRIGGAAAALLTLIPSTVFLLLSPWIMVAYSDTLGLVFPILLVYLYLVQTGMKSAAGRGLMLLALGVTAAVGYQIKPTVVLVLGAIAVVGLLSVVRRPARRQLLAGLAGAVLVAGGYLGGSFALTAATGASPAVSFDVRANEQAFPVAHYLKMGAQASDAGYNHFYGSWHGPDVEETRLMPPEQRTEQNINRYAERVREMGTSGYLSFLNSKLIWFLGDGSFFLWGEGTAAGDPFVAEDPLSRSIQSYYGFDGAHYGTLTGLWQAAWFVLLGLVSLPLFTARQAMFSQPATILRVALLALFVFLLLFEARSRYLYLYLPFFIVLASLSASGLAPRGRKRDRTAAPAA